MAAAMVNILVADKLMQKARASTATFLLWMLSELFEELPEAGDLPKPKLVFFFDEAHLLFTDAPKALMDKIEQVVRLIRSKGVGVYFVTQNPIDVPDKVLAQLGNRVQHALRAVHARATRRRWRRRRRRFGPTRSSIPPASSWNSAKGEALVVVPRRRRHAGDGRGASMVRPPTGRIGPDHAGRAQGDHEQQPGEG